MAGERRGDDARRHIYMCWYVSFWPIGTRSGTCKHVVDMLGKLRLSKKQNLLLAGGNTMSLTLFLSQVPPIIFFTCCWRIQFQSCLLWSARKERKQKKSPKGLHKSGNKTSTSYTNLTKTKMPSNYWMANWQYCVSSKKYLWCAKQVCLISRPTIKNSSSPPLIFFYQCAQILKCMTELWKLEIK